MPVVFSSHQLELVERLCEAVAIVKDGRLVASGTVEELRGARRPHGAGRRSTAPTATAGWRRCPPWSRSRAAATARVLVALRDGATPQDVLDAARRAGAVTHFSLERPTLTDLFRKAVAA